MAEVKKMTTLRSSDGEEFEIEEAVAMQSQTIRHMIEDECASGEIPLPNVNSKILSRVIEFCKKRVEAAASASSSNGPSDKLKAFDAEFIKVDLDTLLQIILAANYLNIKSLFDFTTQTVADNMIKGKTPEEIRKIFNIKNDFTPEEEAELQKGTLWAYE